MKGIQPWFYVLLKPLAAIAARLRSRTYANWKINSHWAVSGVAQIAASTDGYGASIGAPRFELTYSTFWDNGSLVLRAGQLPPAFGLFQTRYDDAVNPLINIPWSYGYGGGGLTLGGLPSAQLEMTYRRLDGRVQFANSSPANPRSLLDSDQYGVWIGGMGYTIKQGLRVGVNGYRGPYLSRDHRFYFRGEAPPRTLQGTAGGVEVQWAQGPWSASGEWQRFRFDYRVIPAYTSSVVYGEVKRVLNPRLFVATRISRAETSFIRDLRILEFAAGYRPNRHQILKLGYMAEWTPRGFVAPPGRFQAQLVTQFTGLSLAKD